MPGPSVTTQQQTQQTPGATSPMTNALGNQGLQQGSLALLNMYQATQNPVTIAATLDSQIASQQQALQTAQKNYSDLKYRIDAEKAARNTPDNVINAYIPNFQQSLDLYQQQAQNAQQSIDTLTAQKQTLPTQVQQYQQQQQLGNAIVNRLQGIYAGTDLGVTPQEQQLITQGIAGISQDEATTRGLNRSDVPVMQAIAPTVSQALLSQANANRSLFTGINQFQQGLNLSNQQLQAGVASTNPAANLTGVYAGLTPSSFSTSGKSQQGYGALDYVNATGQLAKGLGQGYAGFTG